MTKLPETGLDRLIDSALRAEGYQAPPPGLRQRLAARLALNQELHTEIRRWRTVVLWTAASAALAIGLCAAGIWMFDVPNRLWNSVPGGLGRWDGWWTRLGAEAGPASLALAGAFAILCAAPVFVWLFPRR